MAGSSFWDYQENVRGKAKPAAPAAGEKPLTISQLTSKIERVLKAGLPGSVLVQGEVSNFKRQGGSGHLYFTMKDAASCVDCVMWNSDAERLKFTPNDGLELIATGRVGVYAPRGRYQLYVTALQPLGQGALELARQQIQAKLAAEGLFDAKRKKAIPQYPRRIVLVTSRATAAVRDMLKVLAVFPFVKVQVYHVPVQGDGSAEKIAEALAHLSRVKETVVIDLILLGRGGGSLEDLWEFNEEIVARAIAASRIPVISGIGHEIDVSIADLVADYHAHTPTEAAQVAMRHWRTAGDLVDTASLRLRRAVRGLVDEARQRLLAIERHEFFRRPTDRINQLRQLLDDRQRGLLLAVGQRLRMAQNRIGKIETRLGERHPRHTLKLLSQRVDGISTRLARSASQSLLERRNRLELLAARLEALNPEAVLKRGYSVTTHKKTGVIIRDPAQVKNGDTLLTRLAQGQIESTVQDARQLKLFE